MAVRGTTRLLLPAVGLALAVAAVALTRPYALPLDDSYITFGYARNLVDGHGFVFNADQPITERVCGTTTPGFALLLSAIYAGTGVTPDASAPVLFWVFLWGLASLTAALAGGGLVGLLAGIIVLACPFWHAAGCGNEAILVAAGGVGVLLLSARRPAWAAPLAGSMMLIRPEAVALWPAIVLLRRDLWRAWRLHLLWLGGCTLLPVVCFCLSGELLPRSIVAKLTQGATHTHGSVWNFVAWMLPRQSRLFTALVGVLALAGVLTVGSDVRVRAAALWVVGSAAGLLLTHAPGYPWYLTGLFAPIMMLAASGLSYLCRAAAAAQRRHWAGTAALVALTAGVGALIPGAYRLSDSYHAFHMTQRGLPYREMATYLAGHSTQDEWLLAWEGAQVAYTARLNWTDPCGLIEPAWADQGSPHQAVDRIWARLDHVKARYVLVNHRAAGGPFLITDPRFVAAFHQVRELQTDLRRIRLFERVSPIEPKRCLSSSPHKPFADADGGPPGT